MMSLERGIITAVRNFLFAGWKQVQAESTGEVGWVSTAMTDADKAIVRPGSYESQIAANKGTIYACVKIKANAIGKNPLRVFRTKRKGEKSNFKVTRVKAVSEPRKDEIFAKAIPGSALSQADDVEEIVGGHRLVDLLYQVNEIHDNFGLKYLTGAYMSLLGNCYWALLKDRFKQPSAIWIAPAEYMKIIPSNMGVAGYIYEHGTVKKTFKADEVVHIKLPAPGQRYQYYGRGDVMGAADAFNLHEYIQKFEEALFRNNAIVGGVLSTESKVAPAEKKRLQSDFEQVHVGFENACRPLVMQGVKWEPMGATPRELAYQGSRKVMLEEMAADFGIPVALLTGQVSTRAALESSLTQLASLTIEPECILVQEALNAQLTPLYQDNVFVLFDNPVPEDKEYQLKQTEADLKNGVIAIDEERKKRGLEPLGGSAAEPMVDANRIPLSMVGELDVEQLARSVAEKIHEPG